MSRGSFLERLNRGLVIGDGGFRIALEKRGYVTAGEWSCEAVIENPEAVAQLHREFVRAGSDVCQAFTVSSDDEELIACHSPGKLYHSVRDINDAACNLAASIAKPAGCLVAGNICETSIYSSSVEKEVIMDKVRKWLDVFKTHQVDFMICEYYEHVREAEWHIEAIKEVLPGTPVCASLAINDNSDVDGVPTGQCGVRLVRAGADVVGVNCHFDPFRSLVAVKKMIRAVKNAGYDTAHFMVQPLGYLTPDAGPGGFIDLPEYPFALEPRHCTRFEMAQFARAAYEAGVRFIGGCCGTEPYHIRAISEELRAEREGADPPGSVSVKREADPPGTVSVKREADPPGSVSVETKKPWVCATWRNKMEPATGRPYSSPYSGDMVH